MTTCTVSFPLLTVGPLQPPAGMVGCVAPVLSVGLNRRLETVIMGKGSLAWVLFPAVRPVPPVCSLDSVPLSR